MGLSSENKEIGDFFEKESGEPFLKRVREMPEIRNCFFRQDSFCGSYYQHPFPVLTDDDSGIIDPDLGSAVFDDILKNLQTYHFQFIRDAAALSPDLLYYSELNLNQYSVGSPCRNVCTVCGSPPCPDLNLIHYISADSPPISAIRHHLPCSSSKNTNCRYTIAGCKACLNTMKW